MQIPRDKHEKAWLVWAQRKRPPAPGGHLPSDLMEELKSLVKAAGAVVAGGQAQAVSSENPATLIGKGTLERLKETVRENGVELVVFQNLLRPKQQMLLERELEVKVLDRREVILDIFAQRARTKEGKLQVELAQHSFRLGRLIGGRKELSRPGGGIGTRGPGEKKLEEDRRKIRAQLRQIERELSIVRRTRTLHYRRRKEIGFPVVALVGYTNAGKSTLFNRLTGADVFVADQLFATLDPTARKFRLPGDKEAILVDTVGFIHDLPVELREAFLATLEGIGEADLLVHVVDGSSERMEENVASVESILAALQFAEKPALLAVNKSDRGISGGPVPGDAYRVSAATGEGIESLLRAIEGGICLHRPQRNGLTRPA
ncbi:MAG TPA: GTPase HflX [Candidatus Deferrimicrobiaceae bacterium]|nr:GTPase HflX [Candidatus Deferrimicrobiaceae bacterium]